MFQTNPNSANKRIIVTGSSGAGKTTLVELLAPQLFLPIIPEVGRELCESMGYRHVGDIPDQEAFKRKVLETQISTEDKFVSFLSDRSAIDCWVLWQRWNICQAMSYDTESYYEMARAQAQKYTHIIFVPAMFPPEEDGFRWTEPNYQVQIERIVRMTLYDWDLWERTYVVQSSDKQQRAKEVLKWLESRSSS